MTTTSCRWDEYALYRNRNPTPLALARRAQRALADSLLCPAMAALEWTPGPAAGHQRTALRPVRLDVVARRCRRADRVAGGAGGGPCAAHPPRRPHLVRSCLPADAVASCL